MTTQPSLAKYLLDFGCLISVIGIWPRFIEPNLLSTTHIKLPIPNLPKQLERLKIAQISDLHLFPAVPDRFLNKIFDKLTAFNPDLIFYTGDFLCCSQIADGGRLKSFLKRFNAPFGCYCIYGNHDYQSYVAVNREGNYDIIDKVPAEFVKALRRIFTLQKVNGKPTQRLQHLAPHRGLTQLLQQTPFHALENETVTIPIRGSSINVCGVGEYMAGQFNPQKAFDNYNKKFPGIVLAHNPDCIPSLEKFPGELILCGHVHGGQVNIPWIRSRFVVMENPQYMKGTFRVGQKWIHINRGLGGTLRFRLFAPPELTLITLHGDQK